MANVVSDEMYNQLKQLYWWDAGKASKAKWQIESSYTTEKYNQLVNQLNAKYWSWASSSTPKTTTTTNKTSTPQTTVETYRWVVDNPNTSWTSNMNSMSQSSAQYNSRNAQVNTGDVVDMPEQPKVSSVQQPTQDKFAQSWANMTAAQQQAALRKKGMLDYINSKWLTVKKEETPVTTTTKPKQTTYTTPKQQEWDYQDNSQARMDEIARNLNWFRQTNPELFQDPSTFYGFFIDWKGRSQDQIDYLWNYYDRVKKYSKYDNMPASSLWEWLADGSIPKDYLDYIKWVDPQKYQEILSYKQDWEDRIKNESYLEDLSSMAWFESEESYLPKYPDELSYAFETWQLVDEDENWVDDRLYVQPTDEERQDVDRINEINARRMEIKNMQKNLLDDLVEQYPWVPKATLMWIVQDRTKDTSREYDDLGVELVQLQGTVDYLQNERKAQMEAWQWTIDNLQKAYNMYYNYTPAGIISKTRAQYEASNITLDQADNWTETEKQMAVEKALEWYYDKYWSIIQRSMWQAVNDIIAYAKKNWIWLAQALQENFVEPLRAKPEFATLSSWKSLTADKWAKLSDDKLFNTTTWEIIDAKTWKSSSVSTSWNRWETITPISSTANEATTRDLMNKYPSWSTYKTWECGELMNLDASQSGSNIHFWSYLSDKTKWINRETYEWPQMWDYVVFDWTNKPWASDAMRKYWHVWKIVWVWDWYIDIRNQNWSKSWKVSVDRYPLKDYEQYIAWYVDPTKTESYWYWGTPMDDAFVEIRNSWKLNAKQSEALDFSDAAYMIMYNLASNWDIDYFLKSPDWQKVLSNYATAQFSNNADYTEDQILNTLKNNVTDQRILRIVNDLMTVIEKKLRWTSWAAISWSEWNSNSKMLIPQAWENYDTQFRKFQTFEWEYLKKPFEWAKWYAWVDAKYVPLFDWKSPYYKKYIPSAEDEVDGVI